MNKHSNDQPLKGLDNLTFDNRFTAQLPGDKLNDNLRRQVTNACYSLVAPTPVKAPQLIAYAREVAEQLGLDRQTCESEAFAQVFSGNRLLEDMQPYALCYGGHQFGNWAGQLGDGRAINLGEVITSGDHYLTLQLKGAGPTPYSRSADGLAVLRSSVREFLCSEAMHHLGIATTRALSLTLTGESVMRDMFYDGNARPEPGAVVCRVAPSFTRFGSFQIFAMRGELAELKQLADFTLQQHFPHLLTGEQLSDEQRYIRLFEEVCLSTADMIVDWMRVGFVHGVMNTDNMSILGLTIDYGPYGWLEDFDPNWTPNTTDAQGRRYRFCAQAQIAQWNLFQLANALFPLINQAEPLERALSHYAGYYEQQWQAMMRNKLGLTTEQDSDKQLFESLEKLLSQVETDMTLFYRALAELEMEPQQSQQNITTAEFEQLFICLEHCYYRAEQLNHNYRQQLQQWLQDYRQRLAKENRQDRARQQQMNSHNPKYVLRNYLAQQAIELAEQGDFSEVERLLELLRQPYDEQPDNQHYADKRPDWARQKAGCSMLSCSS